MDAESVSFGGPSFLKFGIQTPYPGTTGHIYIYTTRLFEQSSLFKKMKHRCAFYLQNKFLTCDWRSIFLTIHLISTHLHAYHWPTLWKPTHLQPKPCHTIQKGTLCWHPRVRIQGFHPKTWMPPCRRRLWFRASFRGSARMYSPGCPWDGYYLPGKIWYGEDCSFCISNTTPTEPNCLPCWWKSSLRSCAVPHPRACVPDCTWVREVLEIPSWIKDGCVLWWSQYQN